MLSNHLRFSQIKLVTKRAPQNYEAMEEGREAHWEVVQRILFLYAKLNPGQGYVQGMNEIIGPIYYVLASDPDIECRSKTTTHHHLPIYISYLFIKFAEYTQNTPKRTVSTVSPR